MSERYPLNVFFLTGFEREILFQFVTGDSLEPFQSDDNFIYFKNNIWCTAYFFKTKQKLV